MRRDSLDSFLSLGGPGLVNHCFSADTSFTKVTMMLLLSVCFLRLQFCDVQQSVCLTCVSLLVTSKLEFFTF